MERGTVGTALIGPNTLLREALAQILSGADFQVVASAPHIDKSVTAALPQDRALLIIEASSDINATVRQIETFKEHRPAGRVVVLAHQLELPDMVLVFGAGANAYLVSMAGSDVFTKSLELVMLGETILPPSLLNLLHTNANDPQGGIGNLDHDDDGKPRHEAHITDAPADHDKDDDTDDDTEDEQETLPNIDDNRAPHLSARQRLILCCLISGDSNKTIARRIHITEATVKVHVKAILRKIRVHNRTQAAIWAMNNRSLIPTKDNEASSLSKLSNGPSPSSTPRHDSSSGREPPPPSSSEFQIGSARDVPSASDDRLVRKDIDSE
jgi:two-component system, NarL family, nitrate/nitrite response regulator NarL